MRSSVQLWVYVLARVTLPNPAPWSTASTFFNPVGSTPLLVKYHASKYRNARASTHHMKPQSQHGSCRVGNGLHLHCICQACAEGELTRPGSWHGGHGGEYVDIAKAFRRPEVMVGGGHLIVT